MVCSEKLRRWSSSSIIFRRWVTGTPPCDPNLSQPPGNHRSITSREASAAQRLRANDITGEVDFGTFPLCDLDLERPTPYLLVNKLELGRVGICGLFHEHACIHGFVKLFWPKRNQARCGAWQMAEYRGEHDLTSRECVERLVLRQ